MKKGGLLVLLVLTVIIIFQYGGVCHARPQPGGGTCGGCFVETRGTTFVKNGRPFYLNGFNAYWMMVFASDNSTRSKVTDAFKEASKYGMNVARTWAFNDGQDYKPLQISPGSYNEETFKGLDFVVAEAKKYGIQLILSLVNNFKDYGGKDKYVEWAKQQGENVNNEDDFFTNCLARRFYKNHVRKVLTRVNTITGVAYKDDPTIFAWELMNEPRCPSDPSGTHLQIPQVDFSTIHLYPETWLPSNDVSETSQLAFAEKWIQAHIQDSNSIVKKPLVIGEFGRSSKYPEYSLEKRNQYFQKIYNDIYNSARTGGSFAGGLFWQLLSPDMENMGDGYQVVLQQNPSTANIIAQQSQKLSSLT
ncbi:Glycoside hydrolase, family 5 [Corchorus capsularis]|uniref:mannan endo-1,4-beta-mannosidase n=1 Tax=Corchorus capsularis TaxID=210143 RepID=A0A1R3H1I3_COCAP|nr:Glycoside hydrolase, family 5 [Corchorus capsularis]